MCWLLSTISVQPLVHNLGRHVIVSRVILEGVHIMTNRVSRLALVSLVLVLMVLATTVVAASPNAVTFDSISSSCGMPGTGGSDVDVLISAQNVGGDGAAGYEIELEFDHSQLTLDGVTAGSDMTAMNCSFNTQIGFEDGNYSWITGSCTAAASTYATGDIELVTAHLSFTGAPAPYTVSLTTTGVGVPTALLDSTGAATAATQQQLSWCEPTAVELTNVQADSASNTVQYGALLALALVAVIVAGAGFALRRRNSAVGS
jgi:hypothetical protein